MDVIKKIKLTEEQVQQIIEQQSERIAELETRAARVKGFISAKLEKYGELKTRAEDLNKIRDILGGRG